jgi:hypothetical protein
MNSYNENIFDYKDIVDKQHAEIEKAIKSSQSKTEAYLKRSDSLQKKIMSTINAQNQVFSEFGIQLGDKNPFANKFKDSLEGIDDFADKSRESEIAICRAYGLDEPDGGWELFLSKRFRSSKKRKGAQELSDILLRKNSGPSFETKASNKSLSDSNIKSEASNLSSEHDRLSNSSGIDTDASNGAGYNIHNEMINGVASEKSKKFRKSIRRVRI